MEEAKNSWIEKTEKLNFDKDGRKLWKLTKSLNDENVSIGQISLQKNDQVYTGKQAADLFIEEYEEVSNLEIPEVREQEIVQELQDFQNQDEQTEPTEMNSPFKMDELWTALSSLQQKKPETQTKSQMKC